MPNATPPPTHPDDPATSPGADPHPGIGEAGHPHRGVILTGENGAGGNRSRSPGNQAGVAA